jgi:phosphoglycerate dehydrogenase-like enzyme
MTTVWLQLSMPDGFAEPLRTAFPHITFVEGPTLDDATLPVVDAAFITTMIPDDVLARMPQLRWLHGTHGGAGTYLTPPVLERKILVSSSRGTHALAFAEFTIGAMFATAKHIPRVTLDQAAHRWNDALPDTVQVSGSTVGIVGFGAIGAELARLASAVGMRVIATRQALGDKPDYVDWIKTPDAFPELIAESDFVVLAVPGSDSTAGMINEQALRLMKPTAVLINLTARTAIPDEHIVARALREGWIGGAVFNVFTSGARGAISADSPLWDAPNFVVSPRIAALDPNRWQRMRELFAGNLRRFEAGDALINRAN